MTLEILTPDQLVFKGEAQSVVFPGTDGEFGILNHHTAMISTLKKGEIRIIKEPGSTVDGEIKKQVADQNEFSVPVNGGTVEVNKNKILVLAE